MVITVAGEKKEVKDGLTLPELIEQENVEMPEYVTVPVLHGRWMLNGNDR